jgi:aminoglycoside 6-adenylyltransferase
MRNSEEIKQLVLGIAEGDERIRTVLLNGSRANPKIVPDKYQDFDIVFIVRDPKPFTSDHDWLKIFGDKLICQFPDEMKLETNRAEKPIAYHYLMLLADGNRIDLTIFPIDKMDQFHLESATLVWLDKDNLFSRLPPLKEDDHLIKKPREKQFHDTCNEFWWVCPYVAKGLLREEITYAKELLEKIVRPMFMKMIEWYIGTKTNFSVSSGKGGRFMKNYLNKEIYADILKTYSDQQIENNWQALFAMMELFGWLAATTADDLGFHYKIEEQQNVTRYLKQLRGDY